MNMTGQSTNSVKQIYLANQTLIRASKSRFERLAISEKLFGYKVAQFKERERQTTANYTEQPKDNNVSLEHSELLDMKIRIADERQRAYRVGGLASARLVEHARRAQDDNSFILLNGDSYKISGPTMAKITVTPNVNLTTVTHFCSDESYVEQVQQWDARQPISQHPLPYPERQVLKQATVTEWLALFVSLEEGSIAT